MKYLALLRGINVGGKNAVSMTKLKEVLEQHGNKNVKTYINSGNILFESERNKKELEKEVEALLKKEFFPIDIVVLSNKDMQQIVEKVPHSWHKEDLRKYIAFLKSPATPDEMIKETQLKEGVDFVDKGPGVVYMSTKMEGITKTHFPKLATKPIYKKITMRNMNTVEKLFSLMED